MGVEFDASSVFVEVGAEIGPHGEHLVGLEVEQLPRHTAPSCPGVGVEGWRAWKGEEIDDEGAGEAQIAERAPKHDNRRQENPKQKRDRVPGGLVSAAPAQCCHRTPRFPWRCAGTLRRPHTYSPNKFGSGADVADKKGTPSIRASENADSNKNGKRGWFGASPALRNDPKDGSLEIP